MRRLSRRDSDWAPLIAAAEEASGQAHVPYSGLHVGAALQVENGTIYNGCNVENSSFGLTMCAERVAIGCAVADGARGFERLVIYTGDAGPLSPCGACRQVLMEFAPGLQVLSIGRGGLRREFDMAELLPQAFGWPFDDNERPAGDESLKQER